MINRTAAALALAVSLTACGSDGGPRTTYTLTPADKLAMVYTPIRLAASLCAAGVSTPCKDPNVSANVRKAIPIADAAIDSAKRQMAADPSRSGVEKWSSYAMDAIGVLAGVLDAYDASDRH